MNYLKKLNVEWNRLRNKRLLKRLERFVKELIEFFGLIDINIDF